jgi:hypothetical protein
MDLAKIPIDADIPIEYSPSLPCNTPVLSPHCVWGKVALLNTEIDTTDVQTSMQQGTDADSEGQLRLQHEFHLSQEAIDYNEDEDLCVNITATQSRCQHFVNHPKESFFNYMLPFYQDLCKLSEADDNLREKIAVRFMDVWETSMKEHAELNPQNRTNDVSGIGSARVAAKGPKFATRLCPAYSPVKKRKKLSKE